MPAADVPESPATRPFVVTVEMRAVADRALASGLCGECFGRLFGRVGRGLTNPERAGRMEAALGISDRPRQRPCPVCGDAFERLEHWLERAERASAGYEYRRFACGSRWDPEQLAREESLWIAVGATEGENVRSAFNRELGKRMATRTGAEGAPQDPEVVFLADLPTGRVELTVLPLYVKGRYRKLDRTIPQTHWPCRRCRGRGCVDCRGTGKTYPTSVEEILAAPLLRATDGTGTRFHGMGREDIDARMLGAGRPFVLELLRPKRRAIDLAGVAAELATTAAGRVEVDGLAFAERREVVQVKESTPAKSYRVTVLGDVPEEKVNEALTLVAGRAIAQRTPTRVAHRRSDRVRTRRILAARLVAVEPGRLTIELRTDAGTYIKEWVEGDGGRTESSLSELVGVPLKVESLDVLEVHDRPE